MHIPICEVYENMRPTCGTRVSENKKRKKEILLYMEMQKVKRGLLAWWGGGCTRVISSYFSRIWFTFILSHV